MANVASRSVGRQLESLFQGDSVAGLSDRQLLERFTARRDAACEAAFAALVARHGPMVLHVCRQLLGDRHHAEDAFQATFLVLARKARSVSDPDLLANWLYGVALRTARKAKARLALQRRYEEDNVMSGSGPGTIAPVEPSPPPAAQPAMAREEAEALHDEIDRLPNSFRLPIVLCYFEGLTLDEAARRLRWPTGTLRSRLARAREKLRRGLTRRGVVLSSAAMAAALSPRSVSAAASSPLCDATTKAAIHFAAGPAAHGTVAASVTALAQEVLRSMLIHKLKLTALTMLLLCAIATGAGFLTHSRAMTDEPQRPAAGPQAPAAAKPEKPAPGRMFVTGRVLDPQGKPVPGAAIQIHARSVAAWRARRLSGLSQLPIGEARADGSGRFRLDAPRTSSSRYEAFGAVALAPGYGAGWVELDPDDEQPTADITLRPERVIHGRLFDLQGRPVPNVILSVSSISRNLPTAPGGSRSRFEGVSYWSATTNDFPAWPKPVTSDPEGRFTLRGVGRDLRVFLSVHHPQFALQRIEVQTDDTSASKPLTAALLPAQILDGRVTYADTGKPVPHAPLEVRSGQGRVVLLSDFKTDAEGHFRINPPPADRWFGVTAYPPEGQPYLIAVKRLEWPKGALEQSLDLVLPRGVLIQGKVTEEGSGRPVPDAIIDFAYRGQRQNRENASIVTNTAADGSFQVGAAPSPGCLFVRGSSDDYVLQTISSRMLQEGQPGGGRTYAHAFRLLDLKPGMGSQEVHLVLRRGVAVSGQVVGPDGQPVREAWMISRVILNPRRAADGSWDGYHLTARDGRFEIHGLDPDIETPVYFLEPKRKLGAMVKLSGKSIALMTIASQTGRVAVGATVSFSGKSLVRGPITVRLEPCGAAGARIVDADGKPVAGRLPVADITMVDIPGPPYSRTQTQTGRFFAAERPLYLLDPTNYQRELVSDREGRVALPVLIPGASYRFIDYSMRGEAPPQVRKEFTVQPGETLDLGDIRIEKPPR